jgi:hypothetical protein
MSATTRVCGLVQRDLAARHIGYGYAADGLLLFGGCLRGNGGGSAAASTGVCGRFGRAGGQQRQRKQRRQAAGKTVSLVTMLVFDPFQNDYSFMNSLESERN